MKYNWEKTKIEQAVLQSDSYADTLLLLGIPKKGSNINILKRKIKEFNIDISHFTFTQYRNKKNFNHSIDDYLKENTSIKPYKLKLKLFEYGLKENKCECCGISDWNNKPISCQLHHVNGIDTDNRLENLQILCPNCHSQTDNYCGKANFVQKYCPDCGMPINSRSHYCRKCYLKHM